MSNMARYGSDVPPWLRMSNREWFLQKHYRDCEKPLPTGHYANIIREVEDWSVLTDLDIYDGPYVWDGFDSYPAEQPLVFDDDQFLAALMFAEQVNAL